MKHYAIEEVLRRASRARTDSDFTYFFAILLAAEALAKTIVLGVVSAVSETKDRNRYRLEHQLVRADGIGDWGRVLEDALVGPASQYLSVEAREEQTELTRLAKPGEWQYEAVIALKKALDHLEIESEEVPAKTDLKRWFRLFATLRNKTRAHGATLPQKAARSAELIEESLRLIFENFRLFRRSWANLHRNLSGKYRVTRICGGGTEFEYLAAESDHQLPDGIYVYLGGLRQVTLMATDPELRDFFFANGGMNAKRFEFLSYSSDDKEDGDSSPFLTPPGALPASETHGTGDLVAKGNCLTNAPDVPRDYIPRPKLEAQLASLLLDDKRPIVTLLGRGGIGKTSLALRVVDQVCQANRYDCIVWLSSRDVDLQLTGPKPVRPAVVSPEEMGILYANLVLTGEDVRRKGFNAREFLESQMTKCDFGRCLYVFDNFETTQNPVEVFNWIDTYIRLPNKALITTRLREFKGDYPVEVGGMEENEARELIAKTSAALGISQLIGPLYVSELLAHSEGHPYVIKVLLGEVAKNKKTSNIPRLVASSDDILTALFERTYASLSPCAQRAFLTLSAWNSPVPRLALEAVLIRSTQERNQVEDGIEALLQYSLAETYSAPADKQEFIVLPLVAHVFGKKKLNISPHRSSIQSDAEILQMLGPTRRDDIHLGLARKIESFIKNISKRIESGDSEDSYTPILEAICRAYNAGWLLLARFHFEQRTTNGYVRARQELERFLENDPASNEAAEAWRMLAHACYQLGDLLGEVHAFIERAQIAGVSFHDLSSTANRLNTFFHERSGDVDKVTRRELATRMFSVLHKRRGEAQAEDFSRMAWLAIHAGQEAVARDYVREGLALDPINHHLLRLSQRPNMSVEL